MHHLLNYSAVTGFFYHFKTKLKLKRNRRKGNQRKEKKERGGNKLSFSYPKLLGFLSVALNVQLQLKTMYCICV